MRGRKRLRKRLCVGEFQEFGFRLRFQCPEELGEERCDQLLGDFVLNAIRANGLMFAGAATRNRWEGFVVVDARRGSVTEAQRKRVTEWFEGRPEVKELEVGPMVDAWHGQ